MIVNMDFSGRRRAVQPAARRVISAVSHTDDSLKMHERLIASRNRCNELNANFGSAMDSLASANLDIARLNADIERLTKENASLREELERIRGSQTVSTRRSKRRAQGNASSPSSAE